MSKLEMQQCVLGQVFTNCYFLKNKETGELFTYREMLEEWRERYEGINPDNGLCQYHWHTRYDYLG